MAIRDMGAAQKSHEEALEEMIQLASH